MRSFPAVCVQIPTLSGTNRRLKLVKVGEYRTREEVMGYPDSLFLAKGHRPLS